MINRAKEYINENFRRDISLDDVSREVDISPYYPETTSSDFLYPYRTEAPGYSFSCC